MRPTEHCCSAQHKVAVVLAMDKQSTAPRHMSQHRLKRRASDSAFVLSVSVSSASRSFIHCSSLLVTTRLITNYLYRDIAGWSPHAIAHPLASATNSLFLTHG